MVRKRLKRGGLQIDNMKYKLIITDEYLKKGIPKIFRLEKVNGEDFEGNEGLLRNLSSIYINNIPSFLESTILEKDFSQMEGSGIVFGEVLYSENFHVPKNKVGFFVLEDLYLINKMEYIELVLLFCREAIKAEEKFKFLEKKIIDTNWLNVINDSISELKKRIDIKTVNEIEKKQLIIKEEFTNIVLNKKEINAIKMRSENSETFQKTLPLTHTFQNEKYELKFLGSREQQPGLTIDEAKLETQNKSLSIQSFELGLKKFNLYSLGYKNWLFIPEQANAHLLNVINVDQHKQVTWFREHGRNYKDHLIGNYFSGNTHVTVNKRSCIIFDLNTESKQTIKFKNILGSISWAYLLNKNTLRVFFNNENKMACYNIQKESFFDITDIVDQEKYSEINLIHCTDYILKENKHITSFMLVKNKMNNETFQFTENIKN